MHNQINPILSHALKGRNTKRICLLTRSRYVYSLFAGFVFFAFVLLPYTKASVFDKKTILTFNESVQIPGTILEPGTYVVKRADPMANPDVVRFFNADETRLYATVLAIPIERRAPADTPEVSFAESMGNSPQALQTWFYPGEVTGAEFVYPRGSSVMMAKSSGRLTARPSSVPTPESAKPTTSDPGLQAASETQEPFDKPTPAPGPVEIAQAASPSSQSTANSSSSAVANQSQTSATPQTLEQLPKTASNLPLAGLIGMLCVFGGWTLRKFSRRVS